MQNRKNDMVEVQDAIGRHDFDFVRRLAHTLKGICRPYGFLHLETLSRSLEDAALKDSDSEVRQIVDQMKQYINNVRIVYEH